MEEGTHSAQWPLASLAWAHGVLSKLLKHFSPEELDQLVASEELLMQLAKQLNTEGEEASETPETDERGEPFSLTPETPLVEAGLSGFDFTFFISQLGLKVVDDLLTEDIAVPASLHEVWEGRKRDNRFAELRERLVKGGFASQALPKWLQPPEEECV